MVFPPFFEWGEKPLNLFKIFGQIAVDTADAEAGLSRAGNAAEKTESKMGKAFDKIGSAAVACGKVIATGLAAGAAAFGTLAVKSLNLAGELEQNLGGAEAVFGEFASKMEEHASKAFSSMGLSASGYLATANKMGSLFKGAGFEASEAADLTATAMQRAADVASIMGIDVSVAMESVAGAAKGNFAMMDNLGVAINETNLQAYALSKGIAKSTSEMTSQEKIGLAMKMFLEKTADYAGNYAKENETLAGSLTTAKAALSNFLSGVGDASEVGDALIKAGNVIGKKLTALLPTLVSGISALLNKLIPELPPLLESLLPAIVDGAVALVNGLVSSAGAIVDALMGMTPKLIEAALQLMSTLGSALIDNIDFILDSALQIVMMLGQALIDNLPKIADAACTIVEKLGEWIAENADTIVTAGVQLMSRLASTIAAEIPKLIGIAAKSVVKALPKLVAAFSSLWKNLDTGMMIVGGLLIAFKGYSVLTTIAGVVTKLKTAFLGLNAAMSANPFGAVIATVGLAVAGVGALLAATSSATRTTHEFSDEYLTLCENLDAAQESMEALKETYSQDASAILDETKRTENLWEELQTLADETGYVDEANRERASYILGELNEALGTEYDMNDGIIGQYQQMQDEIDTLIQKRQAERLFKEYESQMTAAQTNYETTKDNLYAADQELNSFYAGRADTENRFADFINKLIREGYDLGEISANDYKNDRDAAITAFGDFLSYNLGALGNYGEEASALLGEMFQYHSPEAETEYIEKRNTAHEQFLASEKTMQRYNDAEAAMASGKWEEASDLLLDGANAFWYALENGKTITLEDREALRADLSADEAALAHYQQGLARGDSMLTQERYNELLSDFMEKLALFGDGYVISDRGVQRAVTGTNVVDHSGGAPLDVLYAPVKIDDIIPKSADGIAVAPVSFAAEEKSTMAGIQSTLDALTTAVEALMSGGFVVKMNGREFGRMVRTVKE